jgi:hypothetical protein
VETTAGTNPARFSAFWRRHSRTVEKTLLAVSVTLFIACVADWFGWLPFERGFQPLRTVYLSGAILLQSLAPVVRRRSLAGSFVLLGLSMALFVMSATVHD